MSVSHVARHGLLTAVAVAAAAVGAGAAMAEDLKLGVCEGVSGYLGIVGQPNVQGIEMAVDEINAAGGIDGKWKIETKIQDIRSEVPPSAVCATEMVAWGAHVVISPTDVDHSVAVAQETQPKNILTISSSASSPILPAMVGDYLFTWFTADNLQGAAMAQYAWDQGYRKAYLLVSHDIPYTELLPGYFAWSFEKLGGKVLGWGTYTLGQQDFSAEVTKIANLEEKPDVIHTSAFEPDIGAFMTQLRQAGVTTPVVGSDGSDTASTFGLGDIAEGYVLTTAADPSLEPKVADFFKMFEEKKGEKVSAANYVTAYELVYAIAEAVKVAGGLDTTAIRDAFANLDNWAGTTGPVTYKGTERNPIRTVYIVGVKSSQRVGITKVNPAADKVAPASVNYTKDREG